MEPTDVFFPPQGIQSDLILRFLASRHALASAMQSAVLNMEQSATARTLSIMRLRLPLTPIAKWLVPVMHNMHAGLRIASPCIRHSIPCQSTKNRPPSLLGYLANTSIWGVTSSHQEAKAHFLISSRTYRRCPSRVVFKSVPSTVMAVPPLSWEPNAAVATPPMLQRTRQDRRQQLIAAFLVEVPLPICAGVFRRYRFTLGI